MRNTRDTLVAFCLLPTVATIQDKKKTSILMHSQILLYSFAWYINRNVFFKTVYLVLEIFQVTKKNKNRKNFQK